MKGWTKEESKTVFDHPRLRIKEDIVLFEDGKTRSDYLRFKLNDVNTSVVYHPDKKKYIVNLEYAYCLDDRIHRMREQDKFDGWIYKFPGGVSKDGEFPRDAAHREIEEEIGYKIEIIKELGKVRNYFPRSSSVDYKYYAEVIGEGEMNREREEKEMTQEWFTEDEIDQMIGDGNRKVMHAYFLDTWLLFKTQNR